MAEPTGTEINFLVDIVVPIAASLIAAGAAYLASLRQISHLKKGELDRQVSALDAVKFDLSALHDQYDRAFIDLASDIEDDGCDLTWISAVVTQEPNSFSEPRDWKSSVTNTQFESIQNVRIALNGVRGDVPAFLRGDKAKASRQALVDNFQSCLNTIHLAMDEFGLEVP